MGQHRRFAEEYRRGAARIVIDTGQTVKAEAGQLGLDEQIFGKWVAKERARRIAVESGQPAPDDYPSEIARLRRHVADLKAENEFLGKPVPASPEFLGKPVPASPPSDKTGTICGQAQFAISPWRQQTLLYRTRRSGMHRISSMGLLRRTFRLLTP